MILKLGYVGVGGIKNFKYIENFTELDITSFEQQTYRYHKDKGILIYDKKNEIKGVAMMFNKEVLVENKVDHMNVTYISILDDKSSSYMCYACLSDSVYLMNNNGKTIDKY